jgi:hypothetical protein
MAIPFVQRYSQLVLAFMIGSSGFAWECSLCRKLFTRDLDEALQCPSCAPPEDLVTEFRQHQCAIALSRAFEMVQMDQERTSRYAKR